MQDDFLRSVAQIPNTAYLSRVSVSGKFLNEVLTTYPILRDRQDYRFFMQYLMFGSWFDDDTHELVIDRWVIGSCMNEINKVKWGNVRTVDFLEDFKKDVLSDFEWSGYDQYDGKARVVERFGFDPHISEELSKELRRSTEDMDRRVMFHNGKEYTSYYQRLERKNLLAIAEEATETRGKKFTNDIVQYMNSRSVQMYSKIKERFPEAIKKTQEQLEGPAKETTLRMLRSLEDQHKPIYQPTKKSARVYPLGPSITGLHKDIRAYLLEDYIEMDLVAAQLCINARSWNCEPVLSYLEDNAENFWTDALSHLDLTRERKPPLKRAVYGMSYGQSADNLDEHLREHGLDMNTFLDFPLFQELYDARNEQIKKIFENGGAETITGRWLDHDDFSYGSILAQCSQEIEVQIMYPAVVLAMAKDAIDIVCWAHDGYWLNVRDKRREDYWIQRLQDAVNEKCEKLGVPTYLQASL